MISGLKLIIATDLDGGIGLNGKLPWNIPNDLARFKQITIGHTVIMGRTTYEEIANKFPNRTGDILPGRNSIVLSRNEKFNPRGAIKFDNLKTAIFDANKDEGSIFIIGGQEVFLEVLPWVSEVYLTLVHDRFKCDRHFPLRYIHNPHEFKRIIEMDMIEYSFQKFTKINH